MSRWTTTQAEERHVSQISQQMPIGGLVQLVLKNGTILEGVLRGGSVGNNGGTGGWKYRGQCDVEDKTGKVFSVDYLDIQAASAITDQAAIDEYVRLGRIHFRP